MQINAAKTDWDSLSKRFGGFTDTVIKRIEIDPDISSGSITITLESRETASNNWKLVRLHFEGIQSYAFRRLPVTCNSVISHGIHTVTDGPLTGFDFDGASDPLSDLPELRQSPAHLIASTLTIKIKEAQRKPQSGKAA